MQTFISGIEIKQTLPNGQPVNLECIEGWDDLEELQRLFISSYFSLFPQKKLACMEIGVSTSKVDNWIKNDNNFVHVLNEIQTLHKEALSNVHYAEGYSNSKIRAQILRSLDAEGYERKDVQKNTLVLASDNTMSNVLKALKESTSQ